MALEKKFNAHDVEPKLAARWDELGIHKFHVDNVKKPFYVIDTPPPFPTGEFHTGGTLNWGYIDFAARYKRMQGYEVLFPQGWDCHGFPTETKVEKKFGKGLPREEFRKKCLEFTQGNIASMKVQMKQMGYSIDWAHEYYTIDPEYHRKVQISLVRMFKEGLVYRQEHPVLWCPYCRSAITKAEAEDLPNKTMLNYLHFGLEGSKEKLLIATTRPELLHACVAVMVNPYDERYEKLVGSKAIVPLYNKAVPIIADQDVDKTFGSGAVMVCTFGDKQDVIWAYRHHLEIIDACDGAGFIKNSGKFDGVQLRDAKEKVIIALKEEGVLVEQRPTDQVLKIHDRCKKPIEFLRSTQWFAKLKGNEDKIRAAAHQMSWTPAYTQQLLLDWVDGLEWDWCISRQRVFGIPLPFWYCEKCGKTYTYDEKKLPVDPAKDKPPVPHCECGGALIGEKSICDGWVDSSITPLIICGWPDNEEMFKKLFPTALRPQGNDIIRTWAFYTTYRSLMLTGEKPWKDVLVNGMVCGADGKKMSKSLGNYVEAKEVIAKTGVDALRQWIALSGSTGKDIVFSWKDVNYAQSFLNKLWNASKFVEMALAGYNHGEALTQIAEGNSKKPSEELGLFVTDKWILSKLARLVRKCTDSMNQYDYYGAICALQSFFWHDFCDNYLEDVKHRIYGEDARSKKAAQYALHEVLVTCLKLNAPISPYISEAIFMGMGFDKEESEDGVQSIHQTTWPKPAVDLENDSAEQAVERMHFIMTEVRKYKAGKAMALNEPLARVKVSGNEAEIRELSDYEPELKAVGKIALIEAIVVPNAEGLKVEIA